MAADPLTTHRVVTGPDGQPVLVKRATTPEGRARLTGEASVLRALAHPGIVRVVGDAHDEASTELHLAWVGAHSLATVAGLPVAAAGTIVGQVAAVVADLHRAGIGHGRLGADHVLLGTDGRVVLTGLAEARRLDRSLAADDVAALGALLTALVAPHDDGPVVPEHRRHRVGDGGRRAVLLTLADRASADDPAARPTAAELARELAATGAPRPHHRRRRRAVAGAAAAAALTAVASVAALALGSSAAEPARPVAGPTTTTARPAPSTTRPPSTPPPTTTEPRPAPTTTVPECAPAQPPPTADIDGDGCAEALVIDGPRISLGAVTWVAGRSGDRAVVGDWDCDGTATPATLRPSTGEVFVFDRWVAGSEQVTVPAITTVTDGVTIRSVDPDRDGCPDLVVERADGARVAVGP